MLEVRHEPTAPTRTLCLASGGQQLALSLEQRAIHSYREHEVAQYFSTHEMAELTQLPAQFTEWESEGDLLHRGVA